MGMPGMGMPGMGMPGMGMAVGPRVAPPKPLASVRVVLITDQGQLDVGALEVASLKKDEGWGEARVRFSDLKGNGGQEGAKLEALVFTGNSGGTFFIGHVELVGG